VVPHARAQAWVHWVADGGSTTIVVRNDCVAGPGPTSLHLGHGLSIAQIYADALSATLKAERGGDSFEMRLVLPAPRPSPSPTATLTAAAG
jgi:hypothetical protein